MSLKFYNIQNHGDAEKEFVLLQATADVNIHKYMIADRTFKENGDLSNVHRHTFRFPSVDVKKGEFVVLFTKKGTPGTGKTTDGEKTYRFFWGSDAPFWNDKNVEQAELLEVNTVAKLTLNTQDRKLAVKK
jgi:hypothetical protein